jgi:serine/threonine protein kinase
VLRSVEGGLPWSIKLKLALDCAKGVAQCHRQHVVHRDIAGRNFLVCGAWQEHAEHKNKDFPHALLTDFGLSKFNRYAKANFSIDHHGSPLKWLAPEALLAHQYSFKSDVWALGVALWEIACDGQEPFADMTPLQAAQGVANKKKKLRMPLFDEDGSPDLHGASEGYCELVQSCWAEDPAQRPTAQQVADCLAKIQMK